MRGCSCNTESVCSYYKDEASLNMSQIQIQARCVCSTVGLAGIHNPKTITAHTKTKKVRQEKKKKQARKKSEGRVVNGSVSLLLL